MHRAQHTAASGISGIVMDMECNALKRRHTPVVYSADFCDFKVFFHRASRRTAQGIHWAVAKRHVLWDWETLVQGWKVGVKHRPCVSRTRLAMTKVCELGHSLARFNTTNHGQFVPRKLEKGPEARRRYCQDRLRQHPWYISVIYSKSNILCEHAQGL